MSEPQVKQCFNPALLSVPIPGFCSKDLKMVYEYVRDLLKKKSSSGQIEKKHLDTERQLLEFKKLYEQIQIQEKDKEAKKGYPPKMPIFSRPSLSRKSEEVWRVVDTRASKKICNSLPFRKKCAIEKME